MDEPIDMPRCYHPTSLFMLQERGLRPATFIDIGAAEANFFLARRQLDLFPDARHFFVDAMEENEPVYRKLAAKFGTGHEIAAVSRADGETTLRVDPSFYDTYVEGLRETAPYEQRRTVRMTTLDALVARHALQPPFALKLDLQGGELDALRGASRTLAHSVVLTTEISTVNERDAIGDLMSFMHALGWVVFDITDLGYARLNHTLYQCYVTFVPARLDYRRGEPWASPEQYAELREQHRVRRAENFEAIDELLRNS